MTNAARLILACAAMELVYASVAPELEPRWLDVAIDAIKVVCASL